MTKQQIIDVLNIYRESAYYYQNPDRASLKNHILEKVLPFLEWDLKELKKWLKKEFQIITLINYDDDSIWLLCHNLILLVRDKNHGTNTTDN